MREDKEDKDVVNEAPSNMDSSLGVFAPVQQPEEPDNTPVYAPQPGCAGN